MAEGVKGAVIGYGGAFNMGREHAEYMNAAGLPTVAACDVDPARMESAKADFPGIRTYTDVQDLLKDEEVGLCVVILPHNLHAPVAIACAEAGKHVVVEKPMCVSVQEADAMIEAAQRNGVMLSVYHNRRHDADFLAIKGLIEEGTIGEVFHLEAALGGYNRPGSWWRSDKKLSGGALFDWGAHIIDWILHLVPQEVAGVDGYFHKRVWHESTNEDHTELVARFRNGATAQVEISSIAAVSKPRWRILGTKGGILMKGWDKIEAFVDHNGRIATFDLPLKKVPMAYYENVAGHLLRGEDLDVKPEQARRIIGIIEAAERSSASGQTEAPAYA